MKQNNVASVLCLTGSAMLVSYCVAQTVQKKTQPTQAQASPKRQPLDFTHPMSAVPRPYDPKREARDQRYEKLTEMGDHALPTNPAVAETYYRQATATDASPSDAWIGLARACDVQGKDVQALAAYQQTFAPPSGSGLYSSFPSDVESLARYGILSEDAGQHEAAAKAYNQAIERLNPKPGVSMGSVGADSAQVKAMLNVVRGIALSEAKEHSGQDRNSEAVEAFQEAAQQQPNDARVQYYLGYGYQKTGQFAAAQAAFGKAARLDTEGAVKVAVQARLPQVQAHQR